MSAEGLSATIIATELADALKKDGIDLGTTLGPHTSTYIRSLASMITQPDHKKIAHLIGTIFYYGGFVAETYNERELQALLIKTGNFYNTEDELFEASKNIKLDNV